MPKENNLQSQATLVQKLKWLNGLTQMQKNLLHVKLALEQNIKDQQEPTLQQLRQIAEMQNRLKEEWDQLQDEQEQLDSYLTTLDLEKRWQEQRELLIVPQETALASEDNHSVAKVDSDELSNADSDDESSFFLLIDYYEQSVVDALLARTPQQVQDDVLRLAELSVELKELSAKKSALDLQLQKLSLQQQQLAVLTQQLNEVQQEQERLELELFQQWKTEVLAPQMQEAQQQALELQQTGDCVEIIGGSLDF